MSMRSLLLLTPALMMTFSAAARSHDLANNFNTPVVGSDIGWDTHWLAAAFMTDGQPWDLASVSLAISIPSGTTYDDVVVQLFSTTSTGSGVGQPGASLATLQLSGGTFVPTTDIVLAPSSTYWIVLSTKPGATVYWAYTWVQSGSGVGYLSDWASTDDAGSHWTTSFSAPFIMSVRAEPPPWSALGPGLPGIAAPLVDGFGTLVPGSSGSLVLKNYGLAAPALLFVSTSSTPTPFKGGTLFTVPPLLVQPVTISMFSSVTLPWSAWPAGLSGTTLFFQAAAADAGAVHGVSL